MPRLEKVSSVSAASADLPRIRPATRLIFCGLTRRRLPMAHASVSFSCRLRDGFPMLLSPSLFIGRMAIIRPCRRKFPELVADHVLVHQHRNKLLAVIDAKGEPDKLREDG